MYETGTKVFITLDCRPGGAATGQIGTYEGEFPLYVHVNNSGETADYDYTEFLNGLVTVIFQDDIRPLVDVIPHVSKVSQRLEDYELEHPKPQYPLSDDDESFEIWAAKQTAYEKKRNIPFWFEVDNPRIRLEDGSVIWGIECWWRKADA